MPAETLAGGATEGDTISTPVGAVEPGGTSGAGVLTGHFTELAIAMVLSQSEPVHADRVVQFAARAVTGSEHAALTVTRGRDAVPFTQAGSSSLTYELDALQWETGQGPGLQALTEGDTARPGRVRRVVAVYCSVGG